MGHMEKNATSTQGLASATECIASAQLIILSYVPRSLHRKGQRSSVVKNVGMKKIRLSTLRDKCYSSTNLYAHYGI